MSDGAALPDDLTTDRASQWLGIHRDIVAAMPGPIQRLAARERGYGQAATPPDWLTGAINACEIGSSGEAVRLWRLLYVLAPFVERFDAPPPASEGGEG